MPESADLIWQATAAANLLEARKKKGRLGVRKSRAGCYTCKARRVKCDEKHPECERCTNSGRQCQGYAPRPDRKTNNSLIGSGLSQTLGLRDCDRRTFDYLLSWAAPRLAGPLDRHFWCGHVLRVAQAEPVVLNALLAIATLYEHPQFLTSFHVDSSKTSSSFKVTVPEANRGIEQVGTGLLENAQDLKTYDDTSKESKHRPHPAVVRPPIDQHHKVALQHYNRAIVAFKHRMETGGAKPWLATLSCVLFICIELLRDHVFGALNLFTQGLQLLKEATVETEGVDKQLLAILTLTFERLGVLAGVYGYALDVPQRSREINDEVSLFANIEDARTTFWDLMFEVHGFIRDATAFKASQQNQEDNYPKLFDPEVLQGIQDSTNSASPASNIDAHATEPITRFYLGCLPDNPDDLVSFMANKMVHSLGNSPSSGTDGTSIALDFGPLTLESPQSDYSAMDHLQNSNMSSDIPDTQDSPRSTSQSTTERDTYYLPIDQAGNQDMNNRGGNKGELYWISLALIKRQAQFQKRLKQWHVDFQGLHETNEEAASCLLMHYHMSLVWLVTCLSLKETIFDHYTHNFEQILSLADTFIRSKSAERPTFTFEIGVVPPLYFLLTKCRIPSLRRRGLELMMKAPKKECTFGSRSCAEIAARLIAIEEEGLGLSPTSMDDSTLPSEEDRVQSYELLKDNVTAQFRVRAIRYRTDEDGLRRKVVMDYPV